METWEGREWLGAKGGRREGRGGTGAGRRMGRKKAPQEDAPKKSGK